MKENQNSSNEENQTTSFNLDHKNIEDMTEEEQVEFANSIIDYDSNPHMDYTFIGLLHNLMYENRHLGDWRIKPIEGRYSLIELKKHIYDHAYDFNINFRNDDERLIKDHLIHMIANAMMFIHNFNRLKEAEGHETKIYTENKTDSRNTREL